MKHLFVYLFILIFHFFNAHAFEEKKEPSCFASFHCENIVIENIDLSNRMYSSITFLNVTFKNVNLSYSKFLNSNFKNVQFTDNSILKSIGFNYSRFDVVQFIGSEDQKIDLSHADFSSVNFFNSEGLRINSLAVRSNAFINASLDQSNWDHSSFDSFNGTIYFKNSSIKNVDFSKLYNHIDNNQKPMNRNFAFISDHSDFEKSNLSHLNIYMTIVSDSFFSNTTFINSDIFLGFKAAGYYLSTDKRIVIKNAIFDSTIQNSILNFFNIDGYALINFTGSSFTNKVFLVRSLNNADFSNSNLTNVNLKESTLNNFTSCAFCIFTNAQLTGLQLADSGADFTGSYLNNTKWNSSDIKNSNFSHALIYASDFSNSDLKNVDFTNSTIASSNFSNADLTGAIGFTHDL